MSVIQKLKRAVRGEVKSGTVALEVMRRGRASLARQREHATLERVGTQPPRLRAEFARMNSNALLAHFRNRAKPDFFPGISTPQVGVASLQRSVFPSQATHLISSAERMIASHSWPLLGFGEKDFGAQPDWHRDPVSGAAWPLKYHRDTQLSRSDGSDVRVLWELNRLGHLVTLSRAYVMTGDERFSSEVGRQLESWALQNPYGYGANWGCAMEVALRAMNLLGILQLLRHSQQMNEQRLSVLLTMLDQHGRYIHQNLEFSYLATSNHYLSDVVGLFWLGLMLPEFENAEKWRRFGLREMLREMDKQILPDGADFESSTGYHRFVLELLLYSFILCRVNAVAIEQRYWDKLHSMLAYMRAYLRPDGMAPLVGDSDSGQVFPICLRRAGDHEYVLATGAAVFNDSRLKPESLSGSVATPEELLWLLGEEGMTTFQNLASSSEPEVSKSFPCAGTYILRDSDLYLLFNASGAGINGRGSHGHNDALSIEVSACGRAFIVDPGTYIYTADLKERHRFRSTAYHSTVEIDGVEQNTTNVEAPFVIGDEARPHVLHWEKGPEFDRAVAEHHGYARLPQPVTHVRVVILNKQERWWLIEDEFVGHGNHTFAVRFHFDAGLEVSLHGENIALALDPPSGGRLLVCPLDLKQKPEFEPQFTSSDYGEKQSSPSACWTISGSAPCNFRWAIIPLYKGDDAADLLSSIVRFASRHSSRGAA